MNASIGSLLQRRTGLVNCRKPLNSSLQRQRICRVYANAKADALLEQARGKYKSGDRMTALRLFEQTLEQDSLEASQRQPAIWGQLADSLEASQRHAAMWGQLAVHSSFGDVELAQMVLRDAVQAGLDFEAAQQDPSSFVEIQSSPQVSSDMDLNDLLGPSDPSKQGLDASPGAIAGRVALVLLAGVILGVVLFVLGLEFMFPKGMQ
ncbi:hypothetical protein DUNSADRAFT_16097 [Dunaliella salina]|uniref:Uncharacterized protein n=1 Tax=Dunaliella salina TaxID=3046 RepID=A0ABQ7G474_DUNSA|nr:hypothetical protein DUNSADRAFT_16097 [Dunaliella salina]|eukprot:KAF5829415.1 hypothetical protein DUNSADRAFT_16097 [Dunaliella salina]